MDLNAAQELGIELNSTDDFLNSFILIAVPAACLYPLERIELLLRCYTQRKHKKTGYKTIFSAIPGISKREGFFGYWRGFFAHIVSQVATAIALFYMPRIASNFFDIRIWWHLGLPADLGYMFENGLLLGLTSAASYPFKLIATKLAADTLPSQDVNRPYAGMVDCSSEMFTNADQNGGFYKGFWASLVSDFMQAGAKCLAYANLRAYYEPYLNGVLPISEYHASLLEASIREGSEVIGNFLTYPLQVSVSLQRISDEPEYLPLPEEQFGVWKTLKHLYMSKLPENFVKMFSGFSACFLKSALTIVAQVIILQRIAPRESIRF